MMNRDIKILYRLVLGLAVMVIVSLAFNMFAGVRLIDFSKQQSQQAKRTALTTAKQAQTLARQFAQAVQTSRFDGALTSCESTNSRHENALQYVQALDAANPSAGILATNLLDVLAPLRDGKNGRVTCQQYAKTETALSIVPLSGHASSHSG